MDEQPDREQATSVPVSGQLGQHSPLVKIGLGQSNRGSQYTSSQRTAPLSHTQIRQGSGFQTSLSLYCTPSLMHVPDGTEERDNKREWMSKEVEGWPSASSGQTDEATKGSAWGESLLMGQPRKQISLHKAILSPWPPFPSLSFDAGLFFFGMCVLRPHLLFIKPLL